MLPTIQATTTQYCSICGGCINPGDTIQVHSERREVYCATCDPDVHTKPIPGYEGKRELVMPRDHNGFERQKWYHVQTNLDGTLRLASGVVALRLGYATEGRGRGKRIGYLAAPEMYTRYFIERFNPDGTVDVSMVERPYIYMPRYAVKSAGLRNPNNRKEES